MPRLAISPRLATRTDSSTPGSLQPGRHPSACDLRERLDDAGVALHRVEAQMVERGGRSVPVGRAAYHVVEGVGGPDDHAAEWRGRGLAPGGAALAPGRGWPLGQ